MAEVEKKQDTDRQEPVIDIVRGDRRRQCNEKDFSPYFKQRGWQKARGQTESEPEPAGDPVEQKVSFRKNISATADK
jgi:hypothetical protein